MITHVYTLKSSELSLAPLQVCRWDSVIGESSAPTHTLMLLSLLDGCLLLRTFTCSFASLSLGQCDRRVECAYAHFWSLQDFHLIIFKFVFRAMRLEKRVCLHIFTPSSLQGLHCSFASLLVGRSSGSIWVPVVCAYGADQSAGLRAFLP